jgi:alpha-glucosidase
LRRAHPALLHGSLMRLDLPPPLIGFERIDAAERLLCVFNPSGRPIRIALAAYREAAVLDEYGDAGPRAGDRTTLPPFGVFFAALDRAAVAAVAGAEVHAAR